MQIFYSPFRGKGQIERIGDFLKAHHNGFQVQWQSLNHRAFKRFFQLKIFMHSVASQYQIWSS